MNHVSQFIASVADATHLPKLLPLVHTTDAFSFRSILQDDFTIRPRMDKELNYFFYGRPAYRPTQLNFSMMVAHAPIFLVINFAAIREIRRIFLLDSGAYTRGLFDKYFPNKMPITNLEVAIADRTSKVAIDQTVRMTVQALYGTNRNYYYGVPRQGLLPDSLHFEVKSYLRLASATESAQFDERGSVIEISTADAVQLTPESLLAIIVPDEILNGSTIFTDRLKNFPSTTVMPDQLFRFQAGYFAALAVERVGAFLTARGLLEPDSRTAQ